MLEIPAGVILLMLFEPLFAVYILPAASISISLGPDPVVANILLVNVGAMLLLYLLSNAVPRVRPVLVANITSPLTSTVRNLELFVSALFALVRLLKRNPELPDVP